MKGSNKLFIFTGVALALVAVLMAITMSSGGGNNTDAQDEGEKSGKITVVKASVEIQPFTMLSMSNVVTEEMDAEDAPVDAATDLQMVLGQSYKLAAAKGDFILTSQLQPPGISNQIEAGKRAIALEADNQALMAGLVVDGDYVDVVFKARVDLQRILQIPNVEIAEDAVYIITDVGDGILANGEENSDDPEGDASDTNSESTSWDTNQQFQGAPGSEFVVVDAGQNLEPVAKLLIQDVKVIRVIAPGVKYDAQGQQVQAPEDSTTAEDDLGQLILEVSPEQAEVIAFIQDQNHSYEITVRGEGDHEVANTSGVTFSILINDEQWSMPYPTPMFRPGEYNLPTIPEGPNQNLEPQNTEAPEPE